LTRPSTYVARIRIPVATPVVVVVVIPLYSVALDVVTLRTVTSPSKRRILVCGSVLADQETPVGGLIS